MEPTGEVDGDGRMWRWTASLARRLRARKAPDRWLDCWGTLWGLSLARGETLVHSGALRILSGFDGNGGMGVGSWFFLVKPHRGVLVAGQGGEIMGGRGGMGVGRGGVRARWGEWPEASKRTARGSTNGGGAALFLSVSRLSER